MTKGMPLSDFKQWLLYLEFDNDSTVTIKDNEIVIKNEEGEFVQLNVNEHYCTLHL